MDKSGLFPATENNIIEEYRRHEDIKYISENYGVSVKYVRKTLKKANIKIRNYNKNNITPLKEVGMSERDFYHERNGLPDIITSTTNIF